MQSASHEGAIGACVGEALYVAGIPDASAGDELDGRECLADGSDEREVEARARTHAGEIEDDDRGDPRFGCELGDGEWGEGGECGIGGDRLTGAEVEGENRPAHRAGSRASAWRRAFDPGHELLERGARVGKYGKRLETDYDARGAVVEKLSCLSAGGDAGIYPYTHIRSRCGDRAAERALWGTPQYRIEVGEVELPEAEAVVEGARERECVAGLARRQIRRQWRVTVPIPRACVDRAAAEDVEYRNYAHCMTRGAGAI